MNRLCLAALVAALIEPTSLAAQAAAPDAAQGSALEIPAAPRAISYALVVGSNAGGAGQQPLRYAETDAQRVSEVLTTLGGYDAGRVTRLLQPSGAELFATLEQLEVAFAKHVQAGEATRFFFYYSGHARSDALNIGDERIALEALRERILGLPASLSIVVLDACQSGAFARAKGVGKAEDFSFNSVGELSTEGVAVMASSTGKELSQESDELQSSHFTHHLLVALRGAGDVNGDGAVTLSEAYGYAYGRTLSSTALTRVGEQHVTLETELTGHGDVALTRPVEASARVILPEALAARVLIQHAPSHAVMAEIDKAQGRALMLALPPGRYAATVRQSRHALRCPLSLREGVATALSLDGCRRVELEPSLTKGGASADFDAPAGAHRSPSRAPSRWLVQDGDPGDEGWFLELSTGTSRYARGGAYEARLETFGFQRSSAGGVLDLDITAGRRLLSNLALGLGYLDLDARTYESSLDSEQTFELDAWGGWAFVQGDLSLGVGRLLDVFARGGVGYASAGTTFKARAPVPPRAQADDIIATRFEDVEQSYSGVLLGAALGAQLNFTRWIGMLLQARYTYAPILDNELGESHDVGGLSLLVGLRLRTWESP